MEDRDSVAGVVAFELGQDFDLDDEEWVLNTHGDGVYYYDYESEPMFGSPSRYVGYVSLVDGILFVCTHTGKGSAVARRLVDNYDRVSLSPEQQHQLISNAEASTIIDAVHPKHREELVEDMVRFSSHTDVDEMRAEVRREKYPISKAQLRYNINQDDYEYVKVFLPEVNARIPQTLDAFIWIRDLFIEAINETTDSEVFIDE